MYKTCTFRHEDNISAIFCNSGKNVYIKQLFGLHCGNKDNSEEFKLNQDMFLLDTDKGHFTSENSELFNTAFEKDGINVDWNIPENRTAFISRWSFCEETGIFSRKDIIRNDGINEVIVFRCIARFTFEPGCYEVYSQSSSWCGENRGCWQDLNHDGFKFKCAGGRTTQGFTPYLCLKNKHTGAGAVFHIIPKGNWIIKVHEEKSSGDSLPYAVLELGLSDENLKMCLMPGQQVDLPEILIQELPEGRLELAAPGLHRYLLKHLCKPSDKRIPVVYNTWFDIFELLDTDRLERQLESAKNLGCEVFVVDAGWYGAEEGDWFAQAGDWREKRNGAFHGHMLEFADSVRQKGLGFGLWMEPERAGSRTPVVREHPEWFIPAGNGYFYPDIAKKEVYDYIKGQISELIEKYNLTWMKLDFNFELGFDPYGWELLLYYETWYCIIEEIRNKYPGVFIEGCASGGMRLEINSLSHCDAHFLSDTVYPQDVLKIYEGAVPRLLPGRVAKWAVLRSIGNTVPKYGIPLEKSPCTLITPAGATWDISVTNHIDFTVLAAMPGVFGLSGDIAGLPVIFQKRLRQYIDFYKKYRQMIYNSIGYLLTPLHNGRVDKGWMALQLQFNDSTDSILFIYRLDGEHKEDIIKPVALNENLPYKAEYWDGRKVSGHISGKSLMEEGITVEMPDKFEAIAIIFTSSGSNKDERKMPDSNIRFTFRDN